MGSSCGKTGASTAAGPGRKLLVITSSQMGDHSASNHVTKAFVEAYKKAFPADTIETLDLSKGLQPFTAARVQAKFALYGGADKANSIKEWEYSKGLIDQFKAADKVVIAAPMWNFFMPDTLKLYIDHIVQPNQTFDASNWSGLVVGKPAMIIRSAGGPVATPMDTGLAYLYRALGFIGFTDIRHIAVANTADMSNRAAMLEEKSKEAATAAAAFNFNSAAKPAALPALANDVKPSASVAVPTPPRGSKVLFISASPMGEHSASLTAATRFLEAYKAAVPGAQVTRIDLAALVDAGELPPYTALRVQAKFAKFAGASADLAANVAAEWAYCEQRMQELKDADTLILAVPTWNYAIPYTLSLYFHHTLQPHYTFDPSTFAGLLPKGKHAFIVCAAGGPSLGAEGDFTTPYIKQALGFMGVEKVHIAHINNTASLSKDEGVQAAVNQLKGIAGL